jgi:predicted nucleic acid-binding protein
LIFVDSNVLIDALEPDPVWAAWSRGQIRAAVQTTSVSVTAVVVAEVGPRYATLAIFREVLGDMGIGIESWTDEAGFAAGEAFRRHRRFREGRKSILADFLIGGQAAVASATILTRDPAIYSTYFPQVPLICPEKGPA